MLIEFFLDDIHIDDIGDIIEIKQFSWNNEGLALICEVVVRAINDKIFLQIDGMKLKGGSLSQDFDLSVKILFEVVV